MIHQPVKIKQALIDDILVGSALVLQDHRRAVFVQPEGIDPPAVRRNELRRQKAHAKQCFEILFEKGLNGFLDSVCRAGEFIDLAGVDAE